MVLQGRREDDQKEPRAQSCEARKEQGPSWTGLWAAEPESGLVGAGRVLAGELWAQALPPGGQDWTARKQTVWSPGLEVRPA